MSDTRIEAVFTCAYCAHETRLTIATQSTVEGQPLSCQVCGGEMGQLSDLPTGALLGTPPSAPAPADGAGDAATLAVTSVTDPAQ